MNLRGIVFAIVGFGVVGAGVGFAVAHDEPAAATPAAQSNELAATAVLPPAAVVTPAAATSPATGTKAVRPTVPPPAVRASSAQLEQVLAPIALYPDQLLDQVLMAATYPVEVVEAARWVKLPAHRRLRGEALLAALKERHWDPSVMALVPFPRLLDIMSERLQWTEQLGNAFLAQQADVLAAVQQLRREALAAGSLDPARCRCRVVHAAAAIVIEPANPAAVYVPTCNPVVAYGPWPYPAYPPVVFPVPVGFVWAPVPFVWFSPVVSVAWYGPLWGWAGFDWRHRDVLVDAAIYRVLAFGHAAFRGAVWVHDATYRGDLRADPMAGGSARFARAAIVGGAVGAIAANAAVRHVAVLRGDPHRAWHRAEFRGGWHGAAFRGGWRGAAFRGGWHGAAFRGGWHGAAFRGGGLRGGGAHRGRG
ncbi:MAG TPA: DUF3300 domain-containing protein [Stellaceae bacterium]|nr:DUF3300 domain-containing protein [Stellaceae bacterium]